MNAEATAAQWCKGLRSGEHGQERGVVQSDYGCCAVQVGALETGLTWGQLKNQLGSKFVDGCEYKNDRLGWSFPEIADHIERTKLPQPRELELER